MNRPIWITLALLYDTKMALSDWRRLLDGQFDRVQRYLAKCTGVIAGTIPCPDSGLRLDVVKREGIYMAYPQEYCESATEPLTALTEDDVIAWRLDRVRFERDLSQALGLVPLERTAGLSKLLSLIGTAGQGTSRKRVYLGYAANERDGVDVCMAVAHESRAPCFVALPAFYPACDDLLRRSNFEYIVLEDMVTLGISGMVGKPLHFPDVARETDPLNKSIGAAGQLVAASARQMNDNAPGKAAAKRARSARRNGKGGGRPTADTDKQITSAVQDVLARLKNNPYLKMKRACELAIEKEALTIRWEALRKHVKKALRKHTKTEKTKV